MELGGIEPSTVLCDLDEGGCLSWIILMVKVVDTAINLANYVCLVSCDVDGARGR
jgi:hypothetical protein